MKEQMTYVAIDADNVGESVGNAVLSNDEGKLSSISDSINAGVQIFSQWAEFNGGKVVSSGSDEAVIQVPITSIDELEQLKEEYSKKTGFTVSIGIGETISDSAKALIYAKMNGKNQIMDYTPEMEETMKQTFSGSHQQDNDQGLDQEQSEEDQIEGGIGDDAEESDFDQKQLDMGRDVEKEHTDNEDVAEEISEDHLTEDPQYYDKLKEMESGGSPKKASADEELEEGLEPDSDQALDDLVDSNDPSDEDIDLDGVPDQQEEHGEIDPNSDDIDQDGDVEHEEAMAAEAGAEDQYSDEGDSVDEELNDEDEELSQSIAAEMGEEIPMEEEGMEEEIPMEEEQEQAMEGDFGEEIPMEDQDQIYDEEEAIEGEMGQDESVDHDSLKSVIFESLQNFKQNRQHLESISQENPELYNALIYCLQAMIEMAKELGYGDAVGEEVSEDPMMEDDMLGDEDEMMSQEDSDEEVSEDPMMEDDMLGGEDEDQDVEDEGVEDENKEDFKKNERFIGLMKKMNKAFADLGLAKDEEQNIEAIKEKVKKKLENQKKTKLVSKKKKAAAKKPAFGGKKKKPQKKQSNDGSFCAKSHQKMRASGKDCRSNEDKDSPLCSARRKYSCRGKNEEKNKTIEKSEKLFKFMSNARKK